MTESSGPMHSVREIVYTVSFTVPGDRIGGPPFDRDEVAVEAAAMLRRFTTEPVTVAEVTLDPDDPLQVTAVIHVNDDPSERPLLVRHNAALEAVQRSLGQRCTTDDTGEQWLVDLHTDVALLKVLEEDGWAHTADMEGRIYGYPNF